MLRSTAFPSSVGELHNMYGHYHEVFLKSWPLSKVSLYIIYDDNSYIGHHQLEYL